MSHSRRALQRLAQKLVACALCAALLSTSPGLSGWQALAQELAAPVEGGRPVGDGVQTPVQGLGTPALPVSPELGGVSGLGPSLPENLAKPVVSQTVLSSPMTLRDAPRGIAPEGATRGTAGSAIVPAAGRFVSAVVERAKSTERPVFGLFQKVVDAVSPAPRPQAAASGESKQDSLVPAARTLAAPSSARGWAQSSFDALMGAASGRRHADDPDAPVPGAEKPVDQALQPAAPAGQNAAPAADVPVPAPSAAYAAPARQPSKRGVYGVLFGTLLAAAVAPFYPVPALALPLMGLALGETYLRDGGLVRSPWSSGAFFGAAGGMLAGAALMAFGLPVTFALGLPAVGSMIGHRVETVVAERRASRVAPPIPAPAALKAESVETPKEQAPAAVEAAAPEAAVSAPHFALSRAAGEGGEREKTPRSWKKLPRDARETTVEALIAAKAQAQKRARKVAKDARLVAATIDLDDPNAHWAFVFRSDSRRKQLTVWPKRVGVRKLAQADGKAPTLWDGRLKNLAGMETAYRGLKSNKPRFVPVRVEIVGAWHGDAAYLFSDAKNRAARIPASGRQQPVPSPTPAPPSGPSPPQDKPAPTPPAETPAPPSEPTPPADKPHQDPPTERYREGVPPPGSVGARPVGQDYKWLHEDFFGFRSVHGLAPESPLPPLPLNADTPRILQQISKQFHISKERVEELARQYLLPLDGKREVWLAVYDRMQSANREEFKQLDHKKYQSWTSFRKLANRDYREGWKGTLLRVGELHKHLFGPWRVLYHLFDMFVFGYFRKNISYQWHLKPISWKSPWPFASRVEDFLNVAKPGKADMWLEAALSSQSFTRVGTLGRLRANTIYRGVDRYLIQPVVSPLLQFIARRLTMAVFSAVAMGLLAAFAPFLPLSFSLVAAFPAIATVAHGIPGVVAAVPFVGVALSHVVDAAIDALLKDLIVGPLANTMILSTMLTFPSAVKQSFMDKRTDRLHIPPVLSKEFAVGVVKTFFSWTFWKQNWPSFLAMVTIGAEIDATGVTAAAGDSAATMIWKPITGHEFHLFHTVFAAVERPKEWQDHGVTQHNLMPAGGAITWGNVLLYKLQVAVGFNISDMVFNGVTNLLQAIHPNGVTLGMTTVHGPNAGVSVAAAVVEQASHPGRTPAERAREAETKPGGLAEEIARTKASIAAIQDRLRIKRADLSALEDRSRPLTPGERAEYDRLLKELQSRRDADYVQAKLAEIHDLSHPTPEDAARLMALKRLQDYYDAVLAPPNRNPGYQDSLAARVASLKAIQDRLELIAKGRRESRRPELGTVSRVDEATRQRLEALVGEIEQLRLAAKAELANEQASERLLSAANRSRNSALRDRRSGREMLELHKNLARLATVMDLAFSLDEIAAAEQAISGMQSLLDAKMQKIQDAKKLAEQNQQAARQNQQQVDRWKRDAQTTIDGDKSDQADMVKNNAKVTMAVERIGAFRADINALLARLDAEDGGQSGNALAEYTRRQALLPTLVEWRTNGGKPGDPDYRNLKDLNQRLADANDLIAKVDDGLARIRTQPVEFAGVLVIEVPNKPEAVYHGGDPIQPILDARRAYWQAELATRQKDLDEVNGRLDPNYGASETDDFGDSNPVSLPRWLAREQATVASSQADLSDLTARMDALAQNINRVSPGANLPMLSGMGLEQLKTAMETYADRLSAANIPDVESDAGFQASMDLITLGKLLPYAARSTVRWAKADGAAAAIQDAMTKLPAIQAGLQQATAAIRGLIDDIRQDELFIQSPTHTQAENQALIDRKTAMLTNLRGALVSAQGFLQNQLIPLQQDAIKAVKPDGDKFAKLFNSQIKLYNGAKKAIDHSLPWGLAAKGAADGDKAAAMAAIEKKREFYQKFIDGYDDPPGTHHKGIREFQLEVQQRKDPGFTGTETVYGEVQPFSLPRKITQYQDEKAQRAGQINQQDTDINTILAGIDQRTGNRFNLAATHAMPVGVSATDPASVTRLQAIVDNHDMQNLGDLLKQIGDEYKVRGGDPTFGDGDAGLPPTGVQPPPTLNNDLQVAFLALQAARRLVPTSQQNQQSAAAAYAIARFLYSDGVVTAATKGLNEQIPAAEAFLAKAARAFGDVIADLANDEAYVQSGGTSETGDHVIDRSLADFNELKDMTQAGMDFYGVKQTWDQDTLNSIDKINNYYDALNTLYGKGQTASDAEIDAINRMRKALQKTHDDLETKRKKFQSWMGQLNSKDESALKRIAESLSDIQEKTKTVLERNLDFHRIDEDHARSREIVEWNLRRIEAKQKELDALLDGVQDPGALPAALAARIQGLQSSGGAWMIPDTGDASQVLVVPKANLGTFLDQVFTLFKPDSSGQNLSALKQDLLTNPQGLSNLIPNSKVIDFGDNADGFYLVYQSQFGTPHGLETGTQVTLGNIAKVGGNNVSVIGYQFASPSNPENAPYGDKGVTMRIESIQGKNWVNYLDIDLHRFIQDYPKDAGVVTQASQSRMLVFDDFAVFLFGDRLYVAATGFGDWALNDPAGKPSYYGGDFKTSVKFTEVMRLNAEQQVVFAKDPRFFLQTVNLDFTGYDPDLNQDFVIDARAKNKYYSRTQLGPSVDVGRLLHSQNAFTVDLFFARQQGTDDYTQNSLGVSVLNGFTLKDAGGKPWAVINNRATAERGQAYNQYTDRVSVTLPNKGLVFSAEGKLIGDAKTYYFEANKKTGDHTSLSLGYGSRYVGLNNRLTISANTSFTLGELWKAVGQNAAKDLSGGAALARFNQEMDGFFAEQAPKSKTVAELKTVYMQDVARKLLSQDIGQLARDIEELRKAGAFADNTRVRGMVGWTSNPVSDALGERLIGGGFATGTSTELTLSKGQKALIDKKMQDLYRESLQLQARMLELTKEWQASVEEIAEAQWELKLARFAALNSGSDELRREAEVRYQKAQLRLDQALVRYNALTGRGASDPVPFDNLSASDMEALVAEIRKTIQTPERLTEIFHSLDPEAVQATMGKKPFNLVDWMPFIDRLTLSMGVQFQDMLANQALTLGGSVRLPIYDPSSKEKDHAYKLETQATVEQMREAYRQYALMARRESEQSAASTADAETLRPQMRNSAIALSNAISAYRNGLIPEHKLREAFADWQFYLGGVLESEGRASLASGWSTLDASFAKPTQQPFDRALSRGSAASGGRRGAAGELVVTSLAEAIETGTRNSAGVSEAGYRQQAAAHYTEANAHRIQRAYVDIYAGWGLTAAGVGWIPSISATGFTVYPLLTLELKPEELKELQVRQGRAQTGMYGALKDQVEINLAVQFYQNAVIYKNTEAAMRTIEDQVLPAIGAKRTRGEATQRDYDQAVEQRNALWLANQQARSTLNYLLGRAPDAALRLDLTPEQATADLQAFLKTKDPVGTARKVLDARVEVARSVERMVDDNLKVEQLRVEPVSIVVRSLGRLIAALSDQGIGDPDLVAAARVQTLQAERAREAFDRGLNARRAGLRSELAVARQKRDAAADRALSRGSAALGNVSRGQLSPRDVVGGASEVRWGAASRLEALEWANKAQLLEADLAALGGDPAGPAGPAAAPPASFAELTDRVLAARQAQQAAEDPPELQVFDPGILQHQSTSGLRYYYAIQSLDRVKINRHFAEGWVEVRLRSHETPAEVLVELARLRNEKADRIYANSAAEARARGQILVTQFETNVRLLRWAEAAQGSPQGARLAGDLAEYRREILSRLEGQKAEIAALLGLSPQTPLEDLARLVPADPGGAAGDMQAVAQRYVAEVDALNVEQIRRTLFEDGVPESFGNADRLSNQIRADVIAERMSYKGFTPVAAFGLFRARPVAGAFLEAPDPRQIEQALTNVLSDSLRKELESQGRMRELALRLNLLMTSVSGKSVLLERQQQLIASAEADYRATQIAFERGLASPAALAASQDALARAWLDFTQTAADLKSDFIDLVTELEAVGYSSKSRWSPAARAGPAGDRRPGRSPMDSVLDYWSRRTTDRDFADHLDYLLSKTQPAVDPALRAQLRRAMDDYRLMAEDAGQIRYVREFSPAERLDLLTKADVEGRRQDVAALLGQAVSSLGRLDPATNPAWAELVKFLSDDLREQTATAGVTRETEAAVLAQLRGSYWHAVKAPHAVEGAYLRLEALHGELAQARQALLEDYMMNLKGASDFVMRDIALDRYLKAESAFDAELIATFESQEVRGDRTSARGLDALYDLRGAVARERDRVRFGRGMAAVDALIMLEEGRLSALRWERALPARVQETALALDELKSMKTRWQSDPKELQPLYAATETEADGRRLWTIKGWHTAEEVEALARDHKVEKDAQGRLWLVGSAKDPDPKRIELVSGVDVAEAARDAARSTQEANARTLDLARTFQDNDFVLVSGAGVESGLTYDQLMNLGAQGRLFFFSNAKDPRTGLHGALHPLQGLWAGPLAVEIVVYVGDRPLSRDQFPTRESLEDHIDRLRRSSEAADRNEADDFLRLEAGPKGVARMAEAARLSQARSQRSGWMSLKLASYGFAVDANGDLVETWLTQSEFDEAMATLKAAPRDLAAARSAVAPARRDADRLGQAEKPLKTAADAENVRYQGVQAQVRARLQQAHPDAKKEDIDALLAQDPGFKTAREAFAKKSKAYDDAHRLTLDAQRKADEAEQDAVDAELNVRRAKEWSLYESRDVSLTLDSRNALVGVSAKPAFGASELHASIGRAEGALTEVRGEVYAAVMDSDQNLVRIYLDKDAVDKDGGRWTIEDVDGARWTDGGRTIDPNFRLQRYVDPRAAVDARGRPVALPVLLNRSFLIERLQKSSDRLAADKHWAFKPWNFGNLFLEIPRGILKTPLEVATGSNPTKQGFVGRVYAHKIEGGLTDHHGFFRKALGGLDVLDILPDPVDRVFDPSQFPPTVQLGSAIRPGQDIYGKGARAGKKDVLFGVDHIQRSVRYETEDILNMRQRVFTYFEGGVETTTLEDRRGRDRDYETSRVAETPGRKAIDEALRDPMVAATQDLVGAGARQEIRPDALEVDRVRRTVRIRPGARLSGQTAGVLDDYQKTLQARESQARKAEPDLRDAAARTDAAYGDRLRDRARVSAEAQDLWDRWHRLAWRVGRQVALEAEIAALKAEISQLEDQLRLQKEYLAELERRQREHPQPPTGPNDPNNPNDPNHPHPPRLPSTWWQWFAAAAVLSSLLAAIVHWLMQRVRRRRLSP